MKDKKIVYRRQLLNVKRANELQSKRAKMAKYMREYRASKKRVGVNIVNIAMLKLLKSNKKMMKTFDKNETTEDQLRKCVLERVNEAMSGDMSVWAHARETVIQLYLLNHRIGDLKRAVLAAANRK